MPCAPSSVAHLLLIALSCDLFHCSKGLLFSNEKVLQDFVIDRVSISCHKFGDKFWDKVCKAFPLSLSWQQQRRPIRHHRKPNRRKRCRSGCLFSSPSRKAVVHSWLFNHATRLHKQPNEQRMFPCTCVFSALPAARDYACPGPSIKCGAKANASPGPWPAFVTSTPSQHVSQHDSSVIEFQFTHIFSLMVSNVLNVRFSFRVGTLI